MSCNISVPIEDIAESVAQMLRQQFIEKDGGTGTGNTLTDTVLRGGLTFDATAKQAICDAIERCVAEQIKESQAEQDADIEDKINAGDDRLEDKINGFEDRIDAGRIVGVTREDDTVTVKLANGNEFPFSITDSSSGGDRPVQFAPSSNGDNIEITLADGSVLDMTRQEFADWLAGDESPLTTDEELRNAVRAGKDEVLAELNERLAKINYDQATLKLVVDNNKTGKLVLENEDGTNSQVNLLSTDSGNILEVRETGLYVGDQAPPDLANLYVDLEHGDDSVSVEDGGGSIDKPFRTFSHATDITPLNKSNTIHLRCAYDNGQQQVHIIERRFAATDGAYRHIVEYDQPYVSAELIKCWRQVNPRVYIYPYYALENTKPVLRNSWRESDNYFHLNGAGVERGGSIRFTGIDLQTVARPNDTKPGTSHYGFTSGDGEITFYACYLTKTTNQVQFYQGYSGNNIDLWLHNSVWKYIGEDIDKGIIGLDGSTANITVSNGSYVAWGDVVAQAIENGCGKPVTFESGNSIETLREDGALRGVSAHRTGVPLNVTSNFDLELPSQMDGNVDLSGVNSRLDGLDDDVTSLDGRVTTLEEGGGVTGTGPGGTIDVEDLARSAQAPYYDMYISEVFDDVLPGDFDKDVGSRYMSYGSIMFSLGSGREFSTGTTLFEMKVSAKEATTITQRLLSADNRLIAYLNGEEIAAHHGDQIYPYKDITYNLNEGENLIQLVLANEGGPAQLVLTGEFIDNSNVKFA